MIIWGTKAVYKHLGHVADYCLMCIAPRMFSVERIGMAGHLYYITAGQGELVGYQRVCSHCNTVFNADPEHYANFSKQTMPVPELIKATYPNFAVAYKDRLVLESHIRKAPLALPDDIRRKLIMEPFLLLSSKVTDYYKTTRLQLGGTYIKQEIIPSLGETLARLHPSEEEIHSVLARLVQLQHKIGAKVKLDDLMTDINARLAGTLKRRPAGAARSYGAGAMTPVQKAARGFRLLSYVQVALTAVFMFSLMSTKQQDATMSPVTAWLTCIAFGAIAAGLYMLGTAVAQRKTWSRVVGILASTLMLLGFPIGTIIGIYLLINLVKGWDEGAPAPSFA